AKMLPSDSRQSASPREPARESTGRRAETGTHVWPQETVENRMKAAKNRTIPNSTQESEKSRVSCPGKEWLAHAQCGDSPLGLPPPFRAAARTTYTLTIYSSRVPLSRHIE